MSIKEEQFIEFSFTDANKNNQWSIPLLTDSFKWQMLKHLILSLFHHWSSNHLGDLMIKGFWKNRKLFGTCKKTNFHGCPQFLHSSTYYAALEKVAISDPLTQFLQDGWLSVDFINFLRTSCSCYLVAIRPTKQASLQIFWFGFSSEWFFSFSGGFFSSFAAAPALWWITVLPFAFSSPVISFWRQSGHVFSYGKVTLQKRTNFRKNRQKLPFFG